VDDDEELDDEDELDDEEDDLSIVKGSSEGDSQSQEASPGAIGWHLR